MKITNSQIKAFQRCHRQHHYKFDKLIVPRRSDLPLKRGKWLHELLEAKLLTGSWREKNKELSVEFYKLFEEEQDYYGDLPSICAEIMKSYDYTYREEDKQLKVIEVEYEFEVELPHGHILGGQVDAIVEDSWGLWLMEHKSHKTIPDANFRFIDMQTARYFWALRRLGWPMTGILWNYIRTKPPTKPPQLKAGGISMNKKYDTDLRTFLGALREYDLDPKDYRDVLLQLKSKNTFFRRERVPKPVHVMKTLVADAVHVADEIERGYAPTRSIDRSCTFMCSYFNVCMTDLYGGDPTAIIEQEFQPATKRDYYAFPEDEVRGAE